MWVPHDLRDAVVDFVVMWSQKTDIPAIAFIVWLAIVPSKFYDWRHRYGKINEHNNWIPRDFWLEDWEKQAIIAFFHQHPDEGYRRLTFMMLDADVVAVSPSSVYRVLSCAGLLHRWNRKSSSKGDGFKGPCRPHQHWHIDVSYLNIQGVFVMAYLKNNINYLQEIMDKRFRMRYIRSHLTLHPGGNRAKAVRSPCTACPSV